MERTIRLDVEESFEDRPYRQCTEGLDIAGVPWVPLVGRNSFLRTAKPSPLHTHKGCIEIIFCRNGSCEYESCGEAFKLIPGRVFVSRPNEPHRMMSNPKGLSTYYLLFRNPRTSLAPGDFLSEEISGLYNRFKSVPRLFSAGLHTGSNFVQLFRLLEHKGDGGPERRLRVVTLVMTLLISLLDASQRPVSNWYSRKILEIAKAMKENPGAAYPIDLLTAETGISASSLLAGFKASTGYSPHAYLIKCRIDAAKELLLKDRRSVRETAERLGFPSAQHFANQFRNALGMSPREWVAAQCAQKNI